MQDNVFFNNMQWQSYDYTTERPISSRQIMINRRDSQSKPMTEESIRETSIQHT